jgi:hypothetical protein
MRWKADRISAARNCRAPALFGWAVAALLAIGFHEARAEVSSVSDPPVPILGQIEILAKPYLWLPWTSVGVRPSDTRIPSVSDTIGPGDMVSHLTWVPFMGQVEFRNGPFGLLADYLHAPLKAGISTRNILFTGGAGGLTIDTCTAMFFYRPLVLPDQYVDIGAGFRAWGFDGDISLNPRRQLLQPVSISHGGSWADPLIAIRYHRELGNGFSATAYGDVGGFGIGAHIDWQLVGTIDYALQPGVDLHAGFRSLNFNVGAPRADFNVNMYGPIISATLRF